MASWICQTKKILSTVLSSLTEDLEQSVQDFNDTAHGMNSTYDSKSPKFEEEVERSLSKAVDSEQRARSQDRLLSLKIGRLSPDDQFSEQGDSLMTATTRQPKKFVCPSTSNLRHSKSFPTVSGDHISGPINLDQIATCRAVSSMGQSVTSNSKFSVSSPCLIQVSLAISETSNEKSGSDTCDLKLGQPQSQSKSDEAVKATKLSYSHLACPCHQRDSLKVHTQGKVMKHPGKVVRANTFSIGNHNTQEEPVEAVEGSFPDNSTEKVEDCCDDNDNLSSNIGNITTSLVVEGRPPFLGWNSLRPIKRLLSFAFAQLENLVSLLIEESPHLPVLASRENNPVINEHNVNSLELPNKYPELLSLKILPKCSDVNIDQDSLQDSTFLERTYSSESFVIIDAPSLDCLPGEYGIHSNIASGQILSHGSQTWSDPGTFYQLSNNYSDSGHVFSNYDNHKDITPQSSDYFTFDFRKLVNDSFESRNPNSQNYCPVQKLPDGNLSSSFVLVEHGLSNFSERNVVEKIGSCTDNVRENEIDDDCESIASFIILSDEDEDEFWLSNQRRKDKLKLSG